MNRRHRSPDRSAPGRAAGRGSFPGVLAAASVASGIVQIQVTVVNVALPRMAEDLGAGVADLQWIVVAYTMSFAALLLSAGALGDRIGHGRLFLAGLAAFAASSLGCALAPDVLVLNLARVVQGISAALLVPSSLALLRAACGDDSRLLGWSVAVWSAVGGVSFAAGPVVGGALLAASGWRSLFLVNVVICGIGMALTLRFVSLARAHATPAAVDWAGQITAALAMLSAIGAATVAASSGFAAGPALACAAVAVAATLAFVVAERRAAAPVLPLRFFGDSRFSVATIFGFLINATYTGLIFIVALYLQTTLGYSTLESGLAFVPLTATFVVANLTAGWIIARVGPRPPMIFGALVAAVGYALLVPLGSESSFVAMLPGFVLIPAGMGLTVPAITTAILSSVQPAFAGTASGTLNASRQIGSAIGVALLGALVGAGTAADVAAGLRIAAGVSALLLLAAMGTALLMHAPAKLAPQR